MSTQPADHSGLISREQWEHYTDLPVGEVLRRARMHYGQSLEYVESVLRIRASQLEAIETGELEKLPGRVYAIGFVRAYAEYLGLDGEKMVHLFKVQSVGTKNRPELHFPVPASESKVPNVVILAGSMVALAVLIIVMVFGGGGNTAGDIPPVSDMLVAGVASSAPVPDASPDHPAAVLMQNKKDTAPPRLSEQPLGPAQPPAPPPPAVVINVQDNAWIEIRDAHSKAIISRSLKPGDSYTVPEGSGYTLLTGNLGALEFVVNGDKLAPLGQMGEVKRGLSLDPQALKALAPLPLGDIPEGKPIPVPAPRPPDLTGATDDEEYDDEYDDDTPYRPTNTWQHNP